MSNPNGVVIYDGPSLIDGKPILCILTVLIRKSKNPKTVNMLQTWIVRKDIHPWETEPLHSSRTSQPPTQCTTRQG